MKLGLKMKNALPTLAIIFLLALNLFQTIYAFPSVPIGATTQPTPYESNPTAETSSNVGTVTGAGNARDGDLETNTNFKTGYSTTVGYFELGTFTNSPPGGQFSIGWVDFKISYKAQSTINDKYRIVYAVDGSAWQVLQDWVSGAGAQFDVSTGSQAHRTWSNRAEPNGGGWDWTDIGNVKVRVETQQVSGDDLKKLYLYEVWLSVYPAPVSLPSGVSMSIQPPTIVGMHAGDTFFVDVYATNIVKMWGYQFILDYNSSVLTAADYFSYHPFNFQGPSEVVDEAYMLVDGFDSAKTGWNLNGTPSTPDYGTYLKLEDYPLNFVNATADGKEVGYFGFQNMTATRYGNRAFVEVKAVGDGDDYIDIRVYDSSSGTYVSAGTVTPPAGTAPDYTEMAWVRSSVDIGPILDTMAKLDGAKVYLVKRTVGAEGEIIADAMRLMLPDTGHASLTYNSYFGDSVGTGSTSMSLPIARIYFTVDSDGYSPLHFNLSLLVDTGGIKLTHKIQDGIFTTSIIHDVAVSEVDVSPTQVLPGATVNINVTVKNRGAPDLESFTLTVSYDSTVIGIQNVINLAPGMSTNLTFTWDTTGVAFGLYQIKAEASTVPGETDTADNSRLGDKVLVGVHDIAVVNVTRSFPGNVIIPAGVTLNVSQGSVVYVNVTVANEGNFNEAFDVTALYDNHYGLNIPVELNATIGTTHIALVTGASKTVSFAWDTSNVKFYYLGGKVQQFANWTLATVKANVVEVPYEKGSDFDYTLNNFFQDGIVNVTRSHGPLTTVSGRISTNTTWTSANSPYIVVGDVVVETDIFLTIEPGVVVAFNSGTNLIIDGALIAKGNSTHPITFTSNSVFPGRGDWGTIRFRDTSLDKACIVDWTTVEYASAGITLYRSSPKIDNSILQYNVDGLYSESEGVARISNSVIRNNTYGIRGSFGYYYYGPYPRSEISNSRIMNNTYGVYETSGYLMIQESTISDNTYGIYSSGGTLWILGSEISHNTHGIIAYSATISKSIISNNNGVGVSPYFYRYGDTTYYYDGTFYIKYSTITGNKENGVVSKGSSTIHFSNLYGNTPYDVYNAAPVSWSYGDVNATSNWWGTTDATEINKHIYDYYDDYNLKRVYYQPSLESVVTIPPIAHDVAIINVTASPTTVTAGTTIYITVTVVNEGDFDENITVIVRYDSVQIGKWTAYGLLSPGATTSTSFYWYTWDVLSGTYTISAEVTTVPDETDITDNILVDGQVNVTRPPQPPQPPHASFTYSPSRPLLGETVTFNASSSYDLDGYIISYTWDFGNGTTETETSPITTHAFLNAGYYMVTLTVTDNQSLTNSVYQTVKVYAPPVVSFRLFPEKPLVNETVNFELSVYDPDGWIVSYKWDFGDGTYSTDSWAYHAYNQMGTYTVTLNVTDNDGLTATAKAQITVIPRLIISITPDQGVVGTRVTVTGTNATPNGVVNIYWGSYVYDYYSGLRLIYTVIGTPTSNSMGEFLFSFEVPPSTLGTHYVKAVDSTIGAHDEKRFGVLLRISIDPNSGPVGTKVTVKGTGFPYSTSPGLAYLMFDDQFFAFAMAEENGNMQASINVPFASPGPHTVKALVMTSYPYSETPQRFTLEETFTIIDTTALEVTADVGAIYFKEETAEFYVQTTFKGTAINVTSISAILGKPDRTTETLTPQRIATGLYRIRYTISGKGSMTGTYNLVIEAQYNTEIARAYGTTLKTFLVKPAWQQPARLAALSIASIGLVSAMILFWRKEKKKFL